MWKRCSASASAGGIGRRWAVRPPGSTTPPPRGAGYDAAASLPVDMPGAYSPPAPPAGAQPVGRCRRRARVPGWPVMSEVSPGTEAFRSARDLLLELREDQPAAREAFRWPRPERFNYARDWFDAVAAGEAGDRAALWIIEADGSERKLSYAELAARSRRLAAWFAAQGVRRGDRLLLMLGNQTELWETVLAATRLGAVIIPATTLLSASDVRDRIERGKVRHVVARAVDAGVFEHAADVTRIAVGGSAEGWLAYPPDLSDADGLDGEIDGEDTAGDETLLLYFTSGTTASPKL